MIGGNANTILTNSSANWIFYEHVKDRWLHWWQFYPKNPDLHLSIINYVIRIKLSCLAFALKINAENHNQVLFFLEIIKSSEKILINPKMIILNDLTKKQYKKIFLKPDHMNLYEVQNYKKKNLWCITSP